ncbi:MAG: CinA family nicotinamide mononucleotide deamidase-related protein [Desulfobulbaceae bacterium]|nr:CinA family nicotinamide mononucleotide deamidase-related protein [Desulfobulbaceae bacterium]
MLGEIIAIGDELTSGRIFNTTSGFAANQLFAAGHEIFAMHTIGDTPSLIGEALKRAINRVDFVIVTGGLGSTTDDLTNDAVATALNRPQTLYPEILIQIKSTSNKYPTDLNLEKLAWLPEGAELLNVHAKMAGYMLIYDNTPIFFLPGIPHQMKELFVEQVLPRLAGYIGDKRFNHTKRKIYKIFGLQEHQINKILQHLENTPGAKIGYYPVYSDVHVSLTVSEHNNAASERLFNQLNKDIITLLGDHIYGYDRDTIAAAVGNLLLTEDMRLSVAESCTGGLIAHKITATAGSSAWFEGGITAYSNEVKEHILGVDKELLLKHGAVSSQVAQAMAFRVAHLTGTEIAVSVTGIAGPSGGTKDKKIGTVYIGLFYEGQLTDHLYHFTGNRKQIQEASAQTALDLVRRALL